MQGFDSLLAIIGSSEGVAEALRMIPSLMGFTSVTYSPLKALDGSIVFPECERFLQAFYMYNQYFTTGVTRPHVWALGRVTDPLLRQHFYNRGTAQRYYARQITTHALLYWMSPPIQSGDTWQFPSRPGLAYRFDPNLGVGTVNLLRLRDYDIGMLRPTLRPGFMSHVVEDQVIQILQAKAETGGVVLNLDPIFSFFPQHPITFVQSSLLMEGITINNANHTWGFNAAIKATLDVSPLGIIIQIVFAFQIRPTLPLAFADSGFEETDGIEETVSRADFANRNLLYIAPRNEPGIPNLPLIVAQYP